jgi:hypothetical protein
MQGVVWVTLMFVNVAVASVGLLELLLFGVLGGAIGVFFNTVREIAISGNPDAPPSPKTRSTPNRQLRRSSPVSPLPVTHRAT